MSEDKPKEKVDLLRSFLQGVFYPCCFLLFVLLIAAGIAVLSHGFNGQEILGHVRMGAWVVMALFLVAGFEIVGGAVIAVGPWQNRIGRLAGLFLVWISILLFI